MIKKKKKQTITNLYTCTAITLYDKTNMDIYINVNKQV